MAILTQLRFCQRQLVTQRTLSAYKPCKLRTERELPDDREVRLALALTVEEVENSVDRVALVFLIRIKLYLHPAIPSRE